ncbi:MAG: lysine transporter LysE [Calditrichaeota bacterium]|nr:MAG: lysine transporter LysE [Calditrichota bacterium]
MQIEFIPAVIFVFITTITPGPNNIISTSMGLLYGYKKSLPFLSGIASGYLVIMLSTSMLSIFVNSYFPLIVPYLRYIGAAYICYLAYTVYKNSTKVKDPAHTKPLKYHNGFMLQFINPKVIFCGLTVFTTFLAGMLDQPIKVVLTVLLFTSFCFFSITLWALTGNYIRRFLHTELRMKLFGAMLALALVYTAIDLLELF